MASEIKVDTVSEKTSANGVTIDGLNIKDSKIVTANSVDSDVYVDGSIDTAHIADLNVTTGKIAADAITGDKIADNAINSEHYTDGSIDTAHIAADQVTGAKIADDAINSEHYTDGSIDTAHIADGQITTAKLSTAVFTGATDIGADIVDADLFLMDDGAGGTIRKTAASRIKTYAGGSGLVKLASSKSSDDTGAVTLDGFTSATYDNYRVIGLFVPATDNVDFLFRAVNASGAYSTSNAYSWNYDARRTDNSGSADYANAAHQDTKWKFGDNVNRDAGSDYMALDITLYEWRTNDTSRLMWQGNMINNQNANAGFHQGHGGGKLTSNIDATGISFFFSSGDIDHHSVSVFGVSK